jgi:4,5-dihydroxyphthalate decarboxylase
MVRENAYDAGELAIVTFLQAKAFGKPYVLLPAPISGRFQHHCIGYNIEHGELKPKDIKGRKVRVRTYAQTTGLWVRGILQHEYGVDLDKVTWLTIDEAHPAEHTDPPNCQRIPTGKKLDQMMLSGEIAAAILGNDMPSDPRIRTLVPDAQAAAAQWYKREGVIPINHMFAVHATCRSSAPTWSVSCFG